MAPIVNTTVVGLIALGSVTSASLFSRAESGTATPTEAQQFALDTFGDLDLRLSIANTKNEILNNYKDVRSRSPCHTRASAALERSCSSLENPVQLKDGQPVPGADQIVADNIKAYAASLAVCELQEAKSKVPKTCEALILHERSRGKPSQKQLDQCVTALKLEPQSWTSYSNSKQNVFYICHALSASVRKEETLDIIEEFVKNAGALGDQLLYAPQQAQILFQEVKTEIMQFWSELQHRDAARHQGLEQHWTLLKGDMEADLSDIIKQFRTELHHLQTQSSQQYQEQWDRAQDSFNKASDRVSALVVKQEESAASQTQLYEYAVSLFQQGVIQAVGNATRGLAIQNELMESSYESLLQFGLALANMVLAVDGVEARMVALETGLRSIHTETEKKFAELHSKANQTEETLDRVMDKAIGLQDAVQSIFELFSTKWLDGIGTLVAFVGLNIVYSLLFYGLWERWAGFSVLGSICASTASALVLSFITLAYIVPAYRHVLHFISEQASIEFEIDRRFVEIALCISMIVCVFAVVRHILRRRRRQAPYDPASPPMPKWVV